MSQQTAINPFRGSSLAQHYHRKDTFSLSQLLSYPTAGPDNVSRYITAIILTLVSFTILPLIFFLGFFWRSSFWISRGYNAPPPAFDRRNMSAGVKATATALIVFVLPFVAFAYLFWQLFMTPPGALAAIRLGILITLSSGVLSLYLGTSLFINCAQQNSLRPLIQLQSYLDLVNPSYIVAWAIIVAFTAMMSVVYAFLLLLSVVFFFPVLLIVVGLFYNAIFATALFSRALTPAQT